MARVARGQEEAFGNDSFLDVVANIVGILIILVVVASMRIKHLPSLLSPGLPSKDRAAAALAEAEAAATALRQDLLEINTEMQRVALATSTRLEERAVLAHLVAQGQRELDEKRASLAGGPREQFDVEQAIAKSEARLAQ